MRTKYPYREPDYIPHEHITPLHLRCLWEYANHTLSAAMHGRGVGLTAEKWQQTLQIALTMIGAGTYRDKQDRLEMFYRFLPKHDEWRAAQDALKAAAQPEITMDDPAF